MNRVRPVRRWRRLSKSSRESARGQDVRRAARVARALDELVDVVLGDALLSLTYAAELGDPEGSATLARNVALRHDFGLSRRDGEIRARTAWAVPRQDYLPGVPWHVTGSVLGLDIALAPLALRRTNLDRLPDAPRLPSHERDAFALGVALMNPRRLRDEDLDAIAAAIGRGRLRVAAMVSGREALEAVADAIALDGWRRRAASVDARERPDGHSRVVLARGAPGDRWRETIGSRCVGNHGPQLGRLCVHPAGNAADLEAPLGSASSRAHRGGSRRPEPACRAHTE